MITLATSSFEDARAGARFDEQVAAALLSPCHPKARTTVLEGLINGLHLLAISSIEFVSAA